jgi:hypothetical protein
MNDDNTTNRRLAQLPVSANDVSTSASADLVAWVRTQIASGCVYIVMRQRADEGECIVASWSLPGEGPVAVAAAIEREAHTEGQHLRGPTLFVLYASKDVSSREFVARRTICIEGSAYPRVGETEPANIAGVTGMLMRHADGATKIALQHTSNIIEQYKVLLMVAHQRIADLEAALQESAAMRESLATLSHERELALHRAKIEDKRTDFIKEQLELIIPTGISRLLGPGKDGMPAMTEQIIRQFMGSLKQEQLGAVMAALSPEQQLVIGDLYMRFAAQSKDAAVANAAKEAGATTNGTSNGAPPAGKPPS